MDVGVSAKKLGRKFIGCELYDKYYEISKTRVSETLQIGRFRTRFLQQICIYEEIK